MKTKSIVTITVAFLILLVSTSCNNNDFYEIQKHFLTEEENAVKVFDMMNEKMNTLDSYTALSSGEFNMDLDDKPITIDIDVHVAYQYAENDLLYNEKSTYITEYDGKKTGYDTIKGFQESRMYCRHNSNGVTVEMCSTISASDFMLYLSEREAIDGVYMEVGNFENCSLKDENGDYKLSFSGITSSEQANKLCESLELSLISDYIYIDDILLTVIVSSDFYCKEIIVEPIFKLSQEDDGISVPTMTIATQYKNFNSTEVKMYDIADFKEVHDLRDLDRISKDLRDLYKAEELNFKYTGYKASTDATAKVVQEIDVVDYLLKDGKPTYVIFSTVPDTGTEMSITYSSEKKIVTLGNVANTLESDDRTEKQFVRSLMFPLGIDTNYVYSISESEPGVYLLSFKANDEQKKQIAGQDNVEDLDVEFWISLTYEDGKIKKYTSQICLKSSTYVNQFVTVDTARYIRYEIDELTYKVSR